MSETTRSERAPSGAPDLPNARPESYDDITDGLRRLRAEAGGMSYARIAQRIERARRERGVDEYGARLARSTVYDAFRHGRTRVSADLVEEIALALGEDAEGARAWRTRCLGARPAPEPLPDRERLPEQTAADGTGTEERLLLPEVERAGSAGGSAALAARPGPRAVLVVLCLCLALNLVGKYLNQGMRLPLYMDMTGTTVSAIALGPWYGAAVGLASNALGTLSDGPGALLFAPVNVVGALIWGYGVRRFGMGRTLVSYFRLCMLAAVGCTLTAVPVILLLFPGRELTQTGTLGEVLGSAGTSLVLTVFSANGAYSMLDKVLTGFVALVVLQRVWVRLPLLAPRVGAAAVPGSAGPGSLGGYSRTGIQARRAVRERPGSPSTRGS